MAARNPGITSSACEPVQQSESVRIRLSSSEKRKQPNSSTGGRASSGRRHDGIGEKAYQNISWWRMTPWLSKTAAAFSGHGVLKPSDGVAENW
jgi:hypothetical protein